MKDYLHGSEYPDDRRPEHRIEGIPPHEPPPDLAHFFDSSGALNSSGSSVFMTNHNNMVRWFETPIGQDLAFYLWKIGNGSFKRIGKIVGCTDAKARNIKEHAVEIAALRGVARKKDDGSAIYVDVDRLAESMMGTVNKLHDRIADLVPGVDAKEAVVLLKTMTELSLLLQGKPTSRAASVAEKPQSESQLRKDLASFQKTLERIDKKKGLSPGNTEVT